MARTGAAGDDAPSPPPAWLVDGLLAFGRAVRRVLAPAVAALGLALDVLAPGSGLAGWLYAAAALIALAAAIRGVWRSWRRGPRRHGPRALLNAGVFVLVAVGAPTWLAREWDFAVNAGARARAVRRIEAIDSATPLTPPGRSPQCGADIALPANDRRLAASGSVIASREPERVTVFFVRERRLFGDSAGYLYRSDGSPPPDGLFGCYFNVGLLGLQTRRLADRWFWVEYMGID